MNIKWILKTGTTAIDCTSFPFAYRTMYNMLRKGIEAGRQPGDIVRNMTITGPVAQGAKAKTYSYTAATEKAKEFGLLNANGEIDQREFKKK